MLIGFKSANKEGRWTETKTMQVKPELEIWQDSHACGTEFPSAQGV